MSFRKNYTIKTSVTAIGNRPMIPPSVTYSGRYWTQWFMAPLVAKDIPFRLPAGYKGHSEVVPITD
jgi:hypothetical protein